MDEVLFLARRQDIILMIEKKNRNFQIHNLSSVTEIFHDLPSPFMCCKKEVFKQSKYFLLYVMLIRDKIKSYLNRLPWSYRYTLYLYFPAMYAFPLTIGIVVSLATKVAANCCVPSQFQASIDTLESLSSVRDKRFIRLVSNTVLKI